MEAQAGTSASLMRIATIIRVFIPGIGMQGDREHIRTGVKDLLGAVAGVVVDIQDGDFGGMAEPLGRNGDIIEETIPAANILPGMVTGWAA